MSEFDRDLKVGDIITAYHAGYHKVTGIERRFDYQGKEFNSIIHYVRVANGQGKRARSSKKRCDASFCEKVTIKNINTKISKAVVNLEEKRISLINLLKEENVIS